MEKNTNKKADWIGGAVFLALTFIFVFLMIFNTQFFDWAWGRHHNMLSWYIRPIALLPFIFFAYKRSFSGMMFSVFALATSMAWFPKPETISQDVLDFLSMEIDYLTSTWTAGKILISLTVPLMFALLGLAFWKRSFIYGGFVLIASAVGKSIWGLVEGGQSGTALLPPAAFGLVASLALIYFGYRKKQKKLAKTA